MSDNFLAYLFALTQNLGLLHFNGKQTDAGEIELFYSSEKDSNGNTLYLKFNTNSIIEGEIFYNNISDEFESVSEQQLKKSLICLLSINNNDSEVSDYEKLGE